MKSPKYPQMLSWSIVCWPWSLHARSGSGEEGRHEVGHYGVVDVENLRNKRTDGLFCTNSDLWVLSGEWMTMLEISRDEARLLSVIAQKLDRRPRAKAKKQDVLAMIRHLGCVQL